MFNIVLTYDNDSTFSEVLNVIDTGSERQEHEITVVVDGKDTVSHFSVVCNDDWITVRRVGNIVNVILSENNGLSGRRGTIEFTHNLDGDVRVLLFFVQSKPEYAISATKDGEEIEEVWIHTLLGDNDPEMETEVIGIECTGGLCDYAVRGIVQYAKRPVGDGHKVVKYDHGIKVVKKSDTSLEITNYGKISRYQDTYYEILLAHRNDITSLRRVKVKYLSDGDGQDNGFGFADEGIENGDRENDIVRI